MRAHTHLLRTWFACTLSHGEYVDVRIHMTRLDETQGEAEFKIEDVTGGVVDNIKCAHLTKIPEERMKVYYEPGKTNRMVLFEPKPQSTPSRHEETRRVFSNTYMAAAKRKDVGFHHCIINREIYVKEHKFPPLNVFLVNIEKGRTYNGFLLSENAHGQTIGSGRYWAPEDPLAERVVGYQQFFSGREREERERERERGKKEKSGYPKNRRSDRPSRAKNDSERGRRDRGIG